MITSILTWKFDSRYCFYPSDFLQRWWRSSLKRLRSPASAACVIKITWNCPYLCITQLGKQHKSIKDKNLIPWKILLSSPFFSLSSALLLLLKTEKLALVHWTMLLWTALLLCLKISLVKLCFAMQLQLTAFLNIK